MSQFVVIRSVCLGGFNTKIMFEKIKIEEVDLSKLKVGDYFVIKDFATETKHTSWFNGTNFDSAKIKYVLIERVGQTDV